jgi:integrase
MRVKMTADWVRQIAVRIKRDPLAAAGDYSHHKFPSLILRVRPTGYAAWMFFAVWEPGKPATTRLIARFDEMELSRVLEVHADWSYRRRHEGFDPLVERRKRKEHAQKAKETNVAAVLEQFIEQHVSKLRRSDEAARRLRKDIGGAWARRDVASIERSDVIALVRETLPRGQGAAFATFAAASKFLSWSLHNDLIKVNPASGVSIDAIIGAREPRQRILSDEEIRACWIACGQSGVFGQLLKVLLLCGARRDEVGRATFDEVDEEQRLIRVPPSRFKANAHHLVILCPDAYDIVRSRPRYNAGPYLFTLTGRNPIANFARLKDKLDILIVEQLGRPVADWKIHDLRRTCRTGLSRLKTPREVSERILGHGSGDRMVRTYDQWQFLPEQRSALLKWQNLVRKIVEGKNDRR